MTHEERAQTLVREWLSDQDVPIPPEAQLLKLLDLVSRGMVEASNDELERRRAADRKVRNFEAMITNWHVFMDTMWLRQFPLAQMATARPRGSANRAHQGGTMIEDFDCAFNDSFECEFEDYVAETVIAKESCVCCECRAKIASGDRYEAASGWIDEEEQCYITCEPCAELRSHFSATYGGLVEEASEILFPYLTAGGPCVERLSAAAKAKLFEQWRAWKGLAA